LDGEQLLLYRLGLLETGLIPVEADVGLRYDVLRKLKTRGEFVSVEVEAGPRGLEDLGRKLLQVGRAMAMGIVYRVRSWACATCAWAAACGQEDFSTLKEPDPDDPAAGGPGDADHVPGVARLLDVGE
jgi:hypothetical protein